MSKRKPLSEAPVPPAARNDPLAVEVLRGWICDGGLAFTIDAELFTQYGDDTEARVAKFMEVLVRQTAATIRMHTDCDEQQTFEHIRGLLIDLLNGPSTGIASGGRIGDPNDN